MDSKIIFIERKFPSANMILIKDKRSILIDSGFKSDVTETEKFLIDNHVSPKDLNIIINTHYHSDHVGGNHYFQNKYKTHVAAHSLDAELINKANDEACSAEWLDQPVDPYHVDTYLNDGDVIETGTRRFEVIHTPGHTLGHISLYCVEEKTLICGDLFHANDVGWFNIFREGSVSLSLALQSLQKLSEMDIKHSYSGHGKPISDPKLSINNAMVRIKKWLDSPEKYSWHACKRIFSFTLIMRDGLDEEEIDSYLIRCGWFNDMAIHSFHTSPKEFVSTLIDEMLRSRAASWQGKRLVASAEYNSPNMNVYEEHSKPKNWRKVHAD